MKINSKTQNEINYIKKEGKNQNKETKDCFTIDDISEDCFFLKLLQMKSIQSRVSESKTSPFPEGFISNFEVARNETPVVIVHGTMADKKSINAYLEAAQETGHPAELTTYMTIKDGDKIQESTHLMSRNINKTRMKITEKRLGELSIRKDSSEELKGYLQMSSDLYGSHDETGDKIVSLIPGVIDSMENLMKLDEEVLLETFSGRTKKIEEKLAKDIMKTGFGQDKKNSKSLSKKAAAEIMDSICPKAVLVGHSMGGFCSYNLAINPKEEIGDKNEFTYDAGNGVSTVITLSSPIKLGVKTPLPEGLTSLSYDLLEKHVLNPLETFPGMQFSMVNPFFNAWYSYNKELTKEMYSYGSNISAAMTNPLIYLQKPGYEQISEGSNFIEEHIQNKKVPEGITALAVTNREDGVSEDYRSRLDESQPNAHNMDAEVRITPEDLKHPLTTRQTMAHIKMSKYPFEHGAEFKREILANPKYIVRILEPDNYDGVRWQCMNVILEKMEIDPALFDKPEFKPVLKKIEDVAEERQPFRDSPSFVASKILERVNS